MSREIDARVARDVMGLQNGNIPYSTDMNAAMEVVEKMSDHGWVYFQLNRTEDKSYVAEFSKEADDLGYNENAYGENSPALAICLAALEAVKSDQ